MSLWIGKYGEAIDARARFSLPCQIVSKTVHMQSLRVESRLLQPCCLTWWVFPVSQWACLSMQDPRTAMPRCRLDLLSPQGEGPPLQTFSSLQSFPKGAGPNPVPFSLSYLVTWDLSCSFGCIQDLSASFQLVFCENCSICRCIFDVFVGRVELYILLFLHRDLFPKTLHFNLI